MKRFYFSYLWTCRLCKEGTSFCKGLIFRKLYGFLFIVSVDFTSFGVLLHFPLPITIFFWVWLFMLFYLTSMRFSQSTHLLMYWSLETLMFIIRISKPILVEDLCYNFSISNDPTQIDFPTQIDNCYYHSPALLDYLFLLNLFFALQYLSLCWEILIMYFLSFHWIFFRFKIRCTISPYSIWIHIYTYDPISCRLGSSPWSFERCFKLGAFATAAEFCVWVQVRININITHLKYIVKPHSPSIVPNCLCRYHSSKNHFFCLYEYKS